MSLVEEVDVREQARSLKIEVRAAPAEGFAVKVRTKDKNKRVSCVYSVVARFQITQGG